jgi:hypothetical protein
MKPVFSIVAFILIFQFCPVFSQEAKTPLNILLITADDMNFDALGVNWYDCSKEIEIIRFSACSITSFLVYTQNGKRLFLFPPEKPNNSKLF